MAARRPPIVRRYAPAWLAGGAVGFALLLAGCPTTPVPAGNLSVPGALAAAPDSEEDGDPLIFIAEGDGLDLRAFSTRYNLFVRGPNAISAQSIPLSLSMNGQQLPTFRPTQLTGGQIAGPNSTTLGFVAVAGPANPPRIAVVDAMASRYASDIQVTLATEDAATCKAGGVSVSCLPEDAIDVFATSAHVYALLAPDATGAQSIIRMTPKVESGLPVLTLDLAPTALPAGQYGRISVSADDTYLYAGSLTAPAVVQVLLPTPTLSETFTATQPELQGVGVAVPVVTPSYTGSSSYKNGAIVPSFVLAVLTDGRVLTLDPSLPPAAATAQDSSGVPLSPMVFTAPAQNLVFLPCTGTNCQSTVRYDTASTATITSPAPAFVGLGDGTAVAIIPDNSQPQIFRLLNLTSPPDTGYNTPSPWTDNNRNAAATDALSVNGTTTGYTVDETVTVTFHGEMAGYQGRSGTIASAAGSLTLTDTEGTGAFQPAADCPASSPLLPCVSDLVKITGDLSGDCSTKGDTAVNQTLRITALTTAGQAVLSPLSAGTCVPGRVAYDVLAARGDVGGGLACTAAQIAARACGPWTVTGTTNGYLGRAATNPAGASATTGLFSSPEPQFFYPCDTANCGPAGTTAQAFTLQVAALLQNGVVADPPDDGVFFSIPFVSGVSPFVVTSVGATDGLTTSATTGLTYGLAAIPDWLYATSVGANGLNQFNIPNYSLAGAANFYD